jgi:hypothetical protein
MLAVYRGDCISHCLTCGGVDFEEDNAIALLQINLLQIKGSTREILPFIFIVD